MTVSGAMTYFARVAGLLLCTILALQDNCCHAFGAGHAFTSFTRHHTRRAIARAHVSAVWYAGGAARRVMIAGNWKLNPGTAPEALALLKLVVANQRALEACGRIEDLPDVAIFPPFPYLQLAVDQVAGTTIKVGAQNIGLQSKGAFTGEVGASMVRSLGCELVLLGHSERRMLFDEDDTTINKKLHLALEAGLDVVLCVGETESEFEMGLLSAVCALQLKKGLSGVEPAALARIIIAYEPGARSLS